ncbi:RibD C-terminal domain-containing protein [Geodermatophilus dictyosporus]|uniref:RibD C-terminal domain-containing protein n=1 Tax=Geodermatophilus dictyosporus TaxID=1523247 RepID=A0A1I5V0V9_9ACTN|nr:dihydrofolate reductase family protein [Geodermatophilus dictyosporus]SFQ01109.1 RibD C-terminal domain-containing protein [Geodermatophilus dictyosporus]
MRRLVVTAFLTLDGVVQAPGAPDEDTSGGFASGGWQPPYFDDETGERIVGWFAGAEDFLLGRRTYEIFESWWPHAPQDGDPIATALNRRTKHVASRTLTSVDWDGTARLLEGDVPSAVRALKDRDGGELQVHGSAGLVQTLLREDLVDELRLLTYPVVVGPGKRLFGDGAVPGAWRLSWSAAMPRGAVAAVYERAGELRSGEFTLESVPVVH